MHREPDLKDIADVSYIDDFEVEKARKHDNILKGQNEVRHFGVAAGAQFSSFIIIKLIKRIVEANKDIKVWNISMGSSQEINDNFISAEAAVLDQIQYENDVIFVVACTNKSNLSTKK